MPFTPIHLGPAAVVKAIAGRHFSFMVFGGTQVLMDIEPLIGIIRDWNILHGRTHTLLGAFLIGLAATFSGKPISNFVLDWLKIPHHVITWRTAAISAFIGSYSHVLLDALMHYDMEPGWPLWGGNPLLYATSIDNVHRWCLLAAIVGGIGVALRWKLQGKQ